MDKYLTKIILKNVICKIISIEYKKLRIHVGDEVLQWSGVPLQGRSAEEVAAIVANSKHDSHVELVVSRPLAPSRPVQSWRAHKGQFITHFIIH